MQAELITARQNLMRLLQSTDIKATVCYLLALSSQNMFLVPFRSLTASSYTMQLLDLVGENALNRSLLTLLDQNIAGAYQGNQVRKLIHFELLLALFCTYRVVVLGSTVWRGIYKIVQIITTSNIYSSWLKIYNTMFSMMNMETNLSLPCLTFWWYFII